ncbi:plasmid pRiA4b ORF-3 family protein [Thermolongibacillus altinsuensis]
MKTDELLTHIVEAIQQSNAYKQLPAEYKQLLDEIVNKDYLASIIAEKKKTKRGQKKKTLYQFKIALKDIRPPIWRRVVVPSHITFAQFHKVIQAAMGWIDYHLYEFEVDNILIDVPDEEYELPYGRWQERYHARKVKLEQLLTEEGQTFTYTYDFGDHWVHAITLEKIEETTEPFPHPICLKGKRACPPEDIGGVHGYMRMIETLERNDPNDEERNELIEWYGGEFDPEYFDLEETNEILKSITFR